MKSDTRDIIRCWLWHFWKGHRLPGFLILVLIGSILVGCKKNEAKEKPNIIVLLTDDMGYGDLSSYGSPNITTPNIDKLSDQGIRFTNYEAATWCVPSRVQLLTGLYMPRVNLGGRTGADGKGGIPDSVLTLAEGLKKAGYATGMAGKWHLGYKKDKYLPTKQGFDSWFGLPYSNDFMPPYVETDEPLMMYRDTAVVEYPVNQDSLTVKYTTEAQEFIRNNSKKGNPFFFYLAYNMPHLPLHTTKDFLGTSDAGLYGDVIKTIDWSVGQILETLKKQGINENTIVFFASDNGPWINAPSRMFKIPDDPEGGNWKLHGAGNKRWHVGSAGPLRGSKGTSYEGGTRVPAIIKWPRELKPDQVSNSFIANLDIYRTLLEVGGASLPDYPLDGYNIMALLQGTKDTSPREKFAAIAAGSGSRIGALRIGKWKLKFSKNEPQLFNLNIDPGERHNRAEERPKVVKRIYDRLKDMAQKYDLSIPVSDMAGR